MDFRFKQFSINQSRSAMKVGTDGVLLGAWSRLRAADRRVLDVGTGTGLIALMLAQRATDEVSIVGIDVDEGAVADAHENVALSPWAQRVEVVQGRFEEYRDERKYDLILSNPPFFVDSLLSPSAARSAARHTSALSFDALADGVCRLLSPDGRFCVVLPTEQSAMLNREAALRGLYPQRECHVWTTPESGARRVLTEYAFGRAAQVESQTLVIESAGRHQYSPEYRALTKDYYLKF